MDPERRILAHEAVQGLGELVVIGAFYWLDRQIDHGFGGEDALEREVCPLGAVRIASRALDTHDGYDVARRRGVDVFFLVGMHAEDTANARSLPLPRVEIKLALGQCPLIDADECDLTERLLDQLEGH